jgi:L(+)-tartrate dehydratase alpha subunit
MIMKTTLLSVMYEAMRLAATRLPPDVEAALVLARSEETDALTKLHLDTSLENARLAAAGEGLVCADTGFPLFFVKVGSQTSIEGGHETLWTSARQAVRQATKDNYLRPTMVDPLSRMNPGDNVGPGMPKVELVFEGDGDGLEILAAPKGGGSEIFGTFYRMLYPSDGIPGIMKFVIESIRDACYAGKVCPPAIVGVGIGGTSDLCMKRAKEAALLRAVGSSNPDPVQQDMEDRLLEASCKLGIGAMGSKGINAVMAVHIATAVTHTAALPVAVNAQCLVGRRWYAKVKSDGTATYTGCLPGGSWLKKGGGQDA